jgi:hypothetical protein
VSAVLRPQAAYDAAPMLPPEGAVKGPCLLGSLSFLTDDFDWEGEAQTTLLTCFGQATVSHIDSNACLQAVKGRCKPL